MVIDKILDRKEGLINYKPKQFYNDIMDYYPIFPDIIEPIADALDNGTEKDVKKALCKYILKQQYNEDICIYIKSVNWL
jgi:hypothetical protein